MDGAHDGVDRRDGDVWRLVVDEVVAAQREDMGVIGGKLCQLGVLSRQSWLPEAVERRRETPGRARRGRGRR